MASNAKEVVHDIPPFVRVYKDGSLERLSGEEFAPPSLDPKTGVESKDITISADKPVAARLYIPKKTIENPQPQKLPLLVYIHGGAFLIETPYSPCYHTHLNSLVSESNIVVVSVHYRRAPEHPLPAAYEDSWDSLKWVASHSDGNGPEEWLNRYADMGRVFLAGDSSGANAVHHTAIRLGSERLHGIKLKGIVLVHPWFLGEEQIGDESKFPVERIEKTKQLWRLANPNTSGSDDPYVNPDKDPKAGGLATDRVLVLVAEKDYLRDRGWFYKEVLKKKGWGGNVQVVEHKGHDHVFHLEDLYCENAFDMQAKIAAFLNQI